MLTVISHTQLFARNSQNIGPQTVESISPIVRIWQQRFRLTAVLLRSHERALEKLGETLATIEKRLFTAEKLSHEINFEILR